MAQTLQNLKKLIAIVITLSCFFTSLLHAQTISTFCNSTLSDPQGIVFDASGNLFVANVGNNTISKKATNGNVSTPISSGINSPNRIVFDASGNLYVANYFSNSISKVSPTGIVSIFVSNITSPSGLAFDKSGNLYVSSYNTNTISKVTPSGLTSTFVSSGLDFPQCLAFDSSGNLYTANQGNNSITKISPSGIPSIFVNPLAGLNKPIGLVSDVNGNLYVANYGGNTISKVTRNGNVSTFFSSGLNGPYCLAIDVAGNLYVSNNKFGIISKITINPLPVSFSSLAATKNNKTINIAWQTATELNTNHFKVQRSTSGTSFTDIGTVKATGVGGDRYAFTDEKPANGINYYRLQSVDNDGSRSYSKVVSVNFVSNQSFSIIPNPAKDFATISFSETIDKATISVFDLAGKAVITQSLNGTTFLKLNTQALTNGVYVIKVKTETGSYNEKLLINK